MNAAHDGFHVGIEFHSVLAAISKQIYETPLAFIRENVQNAVDAVRIQAAREGVASATPGLSVAVEVGGTMCEIRDSGIGVSLADLQNLFWTIGASGKRTAEARAAGCVGMFGIGGFANFGVCEALTVISQPADSPDGHWTRLSRDDIGAAGGAIPIVASGPSDEAAPHGTVVRGELQESADVQTLEAYVRDFVQFAQERVYFNGELISQKKLWDSIHERGDLRPIDDAAQHWTQGQVTVAGRLLETDRHVLHADLSGLTVDGEPVALRGWIRFEGGAIDVLKRGFKICATSVGTQIGVTGVLDCDRLAPTAGRDSLDSESSSLVAAIVAALERAAVLAVLRSPGRIAEHTRIFRYVRSQDLIRELGNVVVELADGSEVRLDDLRQQAERGVRVYYATSKNRALSQLLQARGHSVAQLPADSHKQRAVRDYLTSICGAEPFEGRIECAEVYEDLTRFERAFMSELEDTILTAYEVAEVSMVPGRLTEDVPVVAHESSEGELSIYADVRHSEISKLERLGLTSLFTSVVAAFCREYLGEVLRRRSPKFFGSGAINLDWLAKRRSELWVLVSDDIEVLTRSTQRQVVRSSDVQVVRAGQSSNEAASDGEPKLVLVEGSSEFAHLFGYYLRIPNSAFRAYGDVIQQCEIRGAVWAGNKIMFVASDSISTAFQLEVRLDRLITTAGEIGYTAGGAAEIERPLQSLFSGLYFPIPAELEPFLVPTAEQEVRIEVRSDWIDFEMARAWEPRVDAQEAS